ncbi:hypothetical protein P691DRAFT_766910 [Macrolepiota fuliginosa MF-IS2]|uniref:Uncharacterized protein n=1 Tax=Macrolepiota fuliginosa MF-IS2 TaxID=1400762 RepID=A0A9P5WXS6_9AGAR|nr:hypothetical protein P691DRAFT_766910 [Macrolepiota fuliginosa MF-IS2]
MGVFNGLLIVASIYDTASKGKDYSGVVDKDEGGDKAAENELVKSAKTVYVLLDDSLNVVETHTPRLCVDDCFMDIYLLSVRSYALSPHSWHPPSLTQNVTQILVTRHAEHILLGTYYLIHMFDDRIDTRGTVKDLCVQGILDHITHGAEVEAWKDQAAVVTTEEALAQAIDSEVEV